MVLNCGTILLEIQSKGSIYHSQCGLSITLRLGDDDRPKHPTTLSLIREHGQFVLNSYHVWSYKPSFIFCDLLLVNTTLKICTIVVVF